MFADPHFEKKFSKFNMPMYTFLSFKNILGNHQGGKNAAWIFLN